MVVEFLDGLSRMRAVQRSALPFISTLEDYDIFVVCHTISSPGAR